ncbi:MAG TPA: prepilin-type N-terminal cleavage/methylation domain-containing protein [Methylomirabilota bacterium]|nr:prepilin-type N-terminal cleavage/methylation domain-containing protein [Methylomirabilota bacterium]
MKLKQNRTRTRAAFTLIEMIGVLAVIAILAALLIPKVFAAINSAKISNTSTSINTIKTAAIDHYAKFGTLAVDGSGATPQALVLTSDPTSNPGNNYDSILLKEGFIDKLFQVKIGDGTIGATTTRIQLVPAVDQEDVGGTMVDTAPNGTNPAYNLDGDATTGVNNAKGTYVLEAVITGVALADARDLNRVIDGTATALGEPAGGGDDFAGRVKYAAPAAGALAEVHVYLTHR